MRSERKRVKFGDVVTRVTDYRTPTSSDTETYVGLEHLDADSLVVSRRGSDVDLLVPKTAVVRGDVLFARRNTHLRRVAVAPFDCLFSPDGYAFRSKSPELLQDFLAWLVASDSFMDYAVRWSAGTHSKRVKWSDLVSFEFELPSLDEQRKIAATLWAIEEVGSTYRRLLRQIGIVAGAAADDVFSDALGANGLPLADFCERITVGVVVRPAQYYVDRGVPALRSLNVLPNRFDLRDLVFFSSESNEVLSKSKLRNGDVVVVRSGRPGDAAVIRDDLDGANCIDLIIATPREGLLSDYLARLLNSSFGRAAVARRTAGTAQAHFNVGALKKLLLSVPQPEEQQHAVDVLADIDAARTRVEASLGQVQKLRRRATMELLPS